MNRDMLFLFPHKSRQTNSIQFPQQNPYGERYPFTGHLYISLATCTNIPLYKNFFSLEGPKKTAPLHVPQKQDPNGSRHPFPERYLTYLLGSPVKERSLHVPLIKSLGERCLIARALLHTSFKVPSI